MRWRSLFKRLVDVAVSAVGLILISPVFFILALTIQLILGSPIIFSQTRPGLKGRPFLMYKFRTMSDKRDAVGNLLPDENRLTGLGKFLRSTSLDELPELINVLKGNMSLVGPRPLLMQYLDRYSPEQARRHEVKPGITGWAQVNGRNALNWEDKFTLDVWYVDNWTCGLDIKIMAMTLWKVFRREDINSETCATMDEFMGSELVNPTAEGVSWIDQVRSTQRAVDEIKKAYAQVSVSHKD